MAVLADTLDDMLNFAREACTKLGFPRNPIPADLDALETMSFVDYGRQLMLPERHIDEFVSLCLQMFNRRPRPPRIFNGMEQVIEETAKYNKIAIVTGNTAPTVEAFLKEYGLSEYVSILIGVEQKGSRPEKIRRVLNELSQTTDTAYMVGDSLSDIFAAKEAGIQSIAVSWGHQSPSRLKKAAPDYFVASPKELFDLLKEI